MNPTKELRQLIEASIRNREINSTRRVRSFVKKHLPDLLEQVKIKNGGIDRRLLLDLLGMPSKGICGTCHNPTQLERRGFDVCGYCSKSCWCRSSEMASKLLDNPSRRLEVKEKKRLTYLRNTNGKYDNPSKNPEVIRLKSVRCLQRTGYRSPNQNPEVFRKQRAASVKRRWLTMNGVSRQYQGYEHFVLRYLDQHPLVLDFTTEVGDFLLPEIPYEHEGVQRRYLPDIGVLLEGDRKLIIEVKSHYTLDGTPKYASVNRSKFRAASAYCKELNNFQFWVALVSDSGKIEWINGRQQ